MNRTSEISENAEISTAADPVACDVRMPELFELTLHSAAALIWRERRFIGRAVLWGIVAAIILAFVLPVKYDSTTRLMPPDSHSMSNIALSAIMGRSGSDSIGAYAGDLLGMKSSGALFIGVLQSRTVEDRLISRFDLRAVYKQRLWEDARKKLEENTKIAEDRKSGILTITVTDRSAPRAAAMASAYVDELGRLTTELSTSAAHRERVFLEQRLTAVKHDLDEAAVRLSEFSSKNSTLDIGEQAKAMVSAVAVVEGQIIAAKSELKGLEQIYASDNFRVRLARSRIAELEHQLAVLEGSDSADAPARADAAGTQIPSLKQLPILGVTYADLYRNAKIQETVYEILTKQYELAKVEEAKELPSVRVLDPADVPEKKSSPKRSLIVLAGLFLSFAIAAGFVIIVPVWTSIDEENQYKRILRDIRRAVRDVMPNPITRRRPLRGLKLTRR